MDISQIEELVEIGVNEQNVWEIINSLRPIASYTKNSRIIILINNIIEQVFEKGTKKTLISLYDLKIRQYLHKQGEFHQIEKLLHEMKQIVDEIEDDESLALLLLLQWYVKKWKGNDVESDKILKKTLDLIQGDSIFDEYIIYFGKYQWAFENWTKNHDCGVLVMFEECADYFFRNNYYRGFIQSISIISLIYVRTQNSAKLLEQSRKLLLERKLIESFPKDAQGIIYFIIGLGHMLELNLSYAEIYFMQAYEILEPIHTKSIYFSNFLILHSFLSTVISLQGKTAEAFEMVIQEVNLLQQEFYQKNLDTSTKEQIEHTLNLNRFYVYSRLKNYSSQKWQNLIDKIFEGSKTLYSNFMLLTEFILNANLQVEQHLELLSIDNFSLNRVKHIIMYQLEKMKGGDDLHEQCIEILSSRSHTKKTTFIEDAFADLLIAQELYALERYDDISSVLSKYKNKLHRIDVLELRLFMEAFLQVGEFRKGDPLAPALHFMAIKRCRERNFSRLEQRLETYQQTMKEWALTRISC